MSIPTIHQRQLFHWIGKHIDDDKSLSGDERVTAYVDALRGSLERGLWMRSMDEELTLGKRSYGLSRRMACFTENRLSECRYHSGRYGGLGLGFPKRYVLNAGGKPVTYVRHKRGDLYSRYLLELLEEAEAAGRAGRVRLSRLDYLAHFVKPLSKSRGRGSGAPRSHRSRSVHVPSGPPRANLRRRQYGPRMQYQSEGEWRIVQTKELLKRSSVRFEVTGPTTFLRYRVGDDLMTVIFPDRRTQQAALEDPVITARLAASELPVNVFELGEIGEL